MKKFYRRSDGCGRDGEIYESCIEIYKQKGEVCELSDEICGPIGAAHKRIGARSCGAKAAGGDV